MTKYQVGQKFKDIEEDNLFYEIIAIGKDLDYQGNQEYFVKENGIFEDGEKYWLHICVDDSFFDKWCKLI
jgi:hypothetical protein